MSELGTSEFGIRVEKEKFHFDSAHFLILGDGAREQLHGHNYHVAVEVRGELMDGDVVLDFMQFKPIVKRCCDELDHRTLLPAKSPWLRIREDEREVEVWHRDDRFVLPRGDVSILPISNTSSERLAEYLGHRILEKTREAFPSARLLSIRVEVEESPGQAGFFVGPAC